jgi:hypothetical protein
MFGFLRRLLGLEEPTYYRAPQEEYRPQRRTSRRARSGSGRTSDSGGSDVSFWSFGDSGGYSGGGDSGSSGGDGGSCGGGGDGGGGD